MSGYKSSTGVVVGFKGKAHNMKRKRKQDKAFDLTENVKVHSPVKDHFSTSENVLPTTQHHNTAVDSRFLTKKPFHSAIRNLL